MSELLETEEQYIKDLEHLCSVSVTARLTQKVNFTVHVSSMAYRTICLLWTTCVTCQRYSLVRRMYCLAIWKQY